MSDAPEKTPRSNTHAREWYDYALCLKRERDEAKQIAAMATETLSQIKEKYGLGQYNVMKQLQRERDEALKALEAEKALPSNLLDVNAICKQRDELLHELAEARKELVKAIEQRDGAFYLIEYAGELLGVKAQEHKSAHGFKVLQAIKDLIEKSKKGSHE